MTRNVYRTAQGKLVDMGALMLQNEGTRAVGNMNVNARGDVVDSDNKVIDKKNHQVRRQMSKQVSQRLSPTSSKASAILQQNQLEADEFPVETDSEDSFTELLASDSTTVEPVTDGEIKGGLAAAIAKSRAVTQELEKPINKPTGLRKI